MICDNDGLKADLFLLHGDQCVGARGDDEPSIPRLRALRGIVQHNLKKIEFNLIQVSPG